VGTQVGSICLFDLTDFDSAVVKQDFLDYHSLLAIQKPEALESGDTNLSLAIKEIQSKYTVLSHTFATDALPDYQHFSPIHRLKFVSKVGSSPAQIGAMDELGVVSSWSVMEI